MSTPPHSASRWQRWSLWLTLIILLNAGYLWADGSPSLFYVGNVLGHLVLAAFMIGVWGAIGAAMLRQESRAPLTWVTLALMMAAAGTGGALIAIGNTQALRPVLVAHIACSFATAGATLLWMRRRASVQPIWLRVAAAVLVLAILIPATRPLWPQDPTHVITNPALPPPDAAGAAMGGADGPFFPSAAETASGELIPGDFFLDSQSCGRSGCHGELVEQWQASAHHLSSFNNQWYRKSIEYMQEVVGETPAKWCAGCHDPALLFSGKMEQPVDRFLGTEEAHAGLGCVACHSIASVKSTMGNGGYVLEYPAMHELAQSSNPVLQTLHDFVVRVDPEPHRRAFLKPFHRAQPAEFCSSCHKVSLDEPVNHYRWVRGFNTYDNWQASGISGDGARSFYAPPSPQNCVTCHMPRVPSDDPASKGGFIRSHRFAAANTALPVAYGDSAQLRRTTDFLESEALRVDIFAVSEPQAAGATEVGAAVGGDPLAAATTFSVGEERATPPGTGGRTRQAVRVLAPLEHGAAVLQPGSSVRLDIVVRTLGVGHFFPTGTVDAQEAWLEVKAVAQDGTILLWSGGRDSTGTVDPSAHFYRNRLIDAHANLINKRNAWASRATVYVNLIPPGAADVAHYRLQIPPDAAGIVTVTASLHYRKFDNFYNRFAYAGERDPRVPDPAVSPHYDDGPWIFTGDPAQASGPLKEIPTLPIVTMAADSVTLAIATHARMPAETADLTRWNDYGIGLLREGDLKSAAQAFQRVTAIDPDYADGWVNMARTYLQEGDLEQAERALHAAEQVEPGFHKARYFSGQLHMARGDYVEAQAAFEKVAEQFPRDRVVLGDLGRVHYLAGRPREALPYFKGVLAIDPEDVRAHYNLMLAYQALGHFEQARLHERFYLRFKQDERAQALARVYRQRHPHDNNEALPIHEHGSPPAPNGTPR